MRYQTIEVKPRETGKRTGDDNLPVALSRGGKETMSFAASAGAVQGAVRKSGVGGIMELVEEGGTSHLGMLKELQWHPVSRKLQHASFQEVKRNQEVNTTVPIVIVGEPASVAERTGQFLKNSDSIELHAKVSALPDHVTIDVSGMIVGDVLTAENVPLPEGCRAASPDSVICSVTTPTVIEIETPTAETDALGEAVTDDQEGQPAEESAE